MATNVGWVSVDISGVCFQKGDSILHLSLTLVAAFFDLEFLLYNPQNQQPDEGGKVGGASRNLFISTGTSTGLFSMCTSGLQVTPQEMSPQ